MNIKTNLLLALVLSLSLVACQADEAIAEEAHVEEVEVQAAPVKTEEPSAIQKQVAIANAEVKSFDEIYRDALAAEKVDFDVVADLLRALGRQQFLNEQMQEGLSYEEAKAVLEDVLQNGPDAANPEAGAWHGVMEIAQARYAERRGNLPKADFFSDCMLEEPYRCTAEDVAY